MIFIRFPAAIIVAVGICAALAVPGPVLAGPGPCAAFGHGGSGVTARAQLFPPEVHTGCTSGVPSGDASMCFKVTDNPTSFVNAFFATWPSPTARTSDPNGGCSFMCATGNCRVGNDGLPVELLQFGVE